MNYIEAKYGVIGHPIAHSKSPIIHNYWMSKYGIQSRYEAIDITPDDFISHMHTLITQNEYAGFNLTVPHKVMALGACDEISHEAKMIGAVNTIYVRDGKIHGANTDAFGFYENLMQQCSNFSMTGKTVMMIGAGGAARACVYAALEYGAAHVWIANRTREKAELIAQYDKRIEVIDWNDRHDALSDVDLLCNTTSLGMDGQPALDLHLDDLNEAAIVYDIVYAPLMTDLLINARTCGHVAVTGLGMLAHQARKSFEYWFGVLPDYDDVLQARLLNALDVESV